MSEWWNSIVNLSTGWLVDFAFFKSMLEVDVTHGSYSIPCLSPQEKLLFGHLILSTTVPHIDQLIPCSLDFCLLDLPPKCRFFYSLQGSSDVSCGDHTVLNYVHAFMRYACVMHLLCMSCMSKSYILHFSDFRTATGKEIGIQGAGAMHGDGRPTPRPPTL